MTRAIIIVRPEPGASATAARAAEMGLASHTVPLFTVEPVAWNIPDPAAFDVLLLTSANAVRHAGPGLATLGRLACHAVGGATAAAARDAGLEVVATGSAGAQPLVDAMTSQGHRNILWLCGEDRSPLTAGPARIEPVACYRSAAIADPPGWPEAIAAPAIALLHSARAAQRAAQLAGPARKHLIALAISDAVGVAAGPGWEEVCVAARTDDGAMLAMAVELCQNRDP